MDGSTNTFEVLSMNKTHVWNNTCNSVPNLPQKLHRGRYSKMTVLSTGILICGGSKNPKNACSMLRKSDNKWIDFDKMITGRVEHSMTSINDHPIVVGGYSSGALSSTEIYEDNKFKLVNDVPVMVRYACLEPLNKDSAILLGGLQNERVS